MRPPFEWEIEALKNDIKVINGHWFVLNHKRTPVKGTCNGTPYSAIIYWLYLGDELDSVHSLTTNCGSDYCVNPDHIVLKTELEKEASDTVDRPDEVVVRYSKGPPVYVAKTKRRRKPKTNNIDQRLKCITRKIWYPDEKTAISSSHHSKIRSYKCNMCDGWHHTHKGKESSKVLKRRNRKMPYS